MWHADAPLRENCSEKWPVMGQPAVMSTSALWLNFFLSLQSFSPEGSLFNLKAIASLLAIPEVCYVVVVKTIVGIPAGVFHSMFSIVNVERFELTPQTNGYLLTYIGILTAVSA